jgi:hypothetical protein
MKKIAVFALRHPGDVVQRVIRAYNSAEAIQVPAVHLSWPVCSPDLLLDSALLPPESVSLKRKNSHRVPSQLPIKQAAPRTAAASSRE